MKNEERIIELLIETLQKVDRHQDILEEHIRQWKEQNRRWDEQNEHWKEQNDRWNEQNEHWKEQNDTNQRLLHLLEIQAAENKKVSAGLTQNDLIDQEQSKRIEMLHQTWIQEQQVIRGMLDLLMAQNKALKDNNLL